MTDSTHPGPTEDTPGPPERSNGPIGGAAGQPGGAAPGKARVGRTEFDWLVPNKDITVAGKTFNLEVFVVGVVYAVATIWLAIALRDSISVLPDVVEGLFDSFAFSFLFAWIFLVVFAILWYLVFALGCISFRLFRLDPLGRGLSAVVSGFLFLSVFTDDAPGVLWLIMLASVACTAVLYLSPWARAALASSPRAHGRPEPVVLSQAVAVSLFSLLTVVAVILLPGFRFMGDIGASFVFFELFLFAASGAAFVGYFKMRTDPRLARLLLTGAAAAAGIGYLFVTDAEGVAFGLGIAAAIIVPLWVPPSARAFFGDKPLGASSAD
jgi:hypothetical protein